MPKDPLTHKGDDVETLQRPRAMVTAKEIAEYLGVALPTLWRIRRRDSSFPQPIHVSGRGGHRIAWHWDAIEAWIGTQPQGPGTFGSVSRPGN